MSSGYGLNGGECDYAGQWRRFEPQSMSEELTDAPGPSRCFPFWQELLACYVVNTSAEDDSGKKKCAPALEDYYECLHHKKEVGSPYMTICSTN